jgi:TatD DNase family protein
MIDSHAHVAFRQFDADRARVIARAKSAGVTGWIEVGTDLEQSRKAIALAEQHDGVYAAVGVHPSDINDLGGGWMSQLEKLLVHEKVKAIGEVGLDYYRGGTAEQQLPVLKKFIGLAAARSLPVVFHVRSSGTVDAHQDLIDLLRSYSAADRSGGVIHTYSGTVSQAEEYLELGMYLSMSGVVTFRNAGEMAKVAKSMPLDRLLIETDCPFLAPDPYRGQRNEPFHVSLVAEKIADLRGLSLTEIDHITSENARALFALTSKLSV